MSKFKIQNSNLNLNFKNWQNHDDFKLHRFFVKIVSNRKKSQQFLSRDNICYFRHNFSLWFDVILTVVILTVMILTIVILTVVILTVMILTVAILTVVIFQKCQLLRFCQGVKKTKILSDWAMSFFSWHRLLDLETTPHLGELYINMAMQQFFIKSGATIDWLCPYWTN